MRPVCIQVKESWESSLLRGVEVLVQNDGGGSDVFVRETIWYISFFPF
jgi:hypothetical protein